MIQYLVKFRLRFSTSGFPQSNQSFPKLRISPLYVDKSEFIEIIINKGLFAPLITRPRRWGKSLNLDMLKHFFQPNGWQKAIDKDFDIRNGNQYNLKFKDQQEFNYKMKLMIHQAYLDHKYNFFYNYQ